MRNNLYKRPDGFPLKTVEEFKELETDTDRLQELVFDMHFSNDISYNGLHDGHNNGSSIPSNK